MEQTDGTSSRDQNLPEQRAGEPTPAPVDKRLDSSAVPAEAADNVAKGASCEDAGASAPAQKQDQEDKGASRNVGSDMESDGGSRNASGVSATSGTGPAIKRPLEEPAITGDMDVTSIVKGPPAKAC
ncbi:hypothetical protein HPB52_005216 [Rhipicephalus sanguineus]|uniref:Uncharacterized protein n=1 Tax=Rhipicephalus sanguineus TaxID=34632 RepID=A0A9D4PLW0_RHISA|nr:hypothetical protein HPB52_005216 [Rhipicephalus sanguineus]